MVSHDISMVIDGILKPHSERTLSFRPRQRASGERNLRKSPFRLNMKDNIRNRMNKVTSEKPQSYECSTEKDSLIIM